MAGAYISGLASGLDWSTMISQLVAVERKPITLLENQKSSLSTEKSAWTEVNTKLTTLKTAIASLSSKDDFNLFTTSSAVTGTSKSVSELMSFSAGTSASEGSYNITIKQLATAQKNVSKGFGSSSDALGLSAGEVTINGRTFSIDETDSLTTIRDKINALNTGENPAGVTASIIAVSDSSYYLTLTSKTTGTDGFSISDSSSGSILAQFGFTTTAGKDAIIEIDDLEITRSSNTITDAIEGVTLKLTGADENAEITLDVKRDTDSVKANIKKFVDGYNELMTYIATQNAVSADGKTTGTLFADSSLRYIKNTLRDAVLSQVSGLDSTLTYLSQIGINIDMSGKLSIDDDTLDGYLESNFQDVVNLFATQGTSTSSNLTYIYSGNKTAEGDYEVEITRAATQASITGSAFSGTLGSDTTLTLTGSGGRTQTITLSAGSNLDAIVDAINAGNTLGVVAENDGGALKLSSSAYGTSGNFTVSGISGTLGIADNTYTGFDVAGRIRVEGSSEWMTMTGSGQNLTGDAGQAVEGLVIKYSGTSDTATLDFTFKKGVGGTIDQALSAMTNSIDGYIVNKQNTLQKQMDNLDKKIERKEASLDKYVESLSAKFTAMETMLSTLESQKSWLETTISSLMSNS